MQIILQLMLSTMAGLAIVVAWRGAIADGPGALRADQITMMQIGELFAITASIVLARRVLDRRTFTSLGLKPGRHAGKDFAAGLVITLLMMGLIFLIEHALGWLRVSGFAWQYQATREVLLNTGTFLLICIIVGWNEELMSRGYHLQTLASGMNLRWGWFLSSAVFGILHLANPNASWVAVAGILLAGLFLGYGFIRSGQLWLSMGLHTGWNFFEGVVFGFPVSGLAFYHLPRTVVNGPPIWTGGEFGPEAGIVLIPALLVGFLLVFLYTRGRQRG